VGGSYATAHPLRVGLAGTDFGAVLVHGRVGGAADAADYYSFTAREGDKVILLAKSEEYVAVAATLQPDVPPHAPSIDARLQALDMRLWSPRVAETLRSAPPLTVPARLELNVNESGTWAVSLQSVGTTNYTLSVAVVPVALAPPLPAGASCGAAGSPSLLAPAANAFRAGGPDRAFYRFDAAIGDDVTVALEMAEPDGADFDLFLYDRTCYLLGRSELGKSLVYPGDSPKGVPDAVPRWPALYTGAYFVEVRRVVGVGGYVVGVADANAMPTLPQNDATTGRDASDDMARPTMLPLGEGAFQGRFEDGDPRDVYGFTVNARESIAISFTPALLNAAFMEVRGMNVVERLDPGGAGTVFVGVPASPSGGLITVILTPTVGGGNYALAVAHA
jgi:hypothetical protein